MLNKLSPRQGSKKQRKRVGRGHGCHGKTSGRGHKGQKSRTGGGVSRWFEGGQSPLKMRLPKRGFTNTFKKIYEIINVKDLEVFEDGRTITPQELLKAGKIKGKCEVKLLADGEITKKLNVKVHHYSKAAAEKIEKAGGTVESL